MATETKLKTETAQPQPMTGETSRNLPGKPLPRLETGAKVQPIIPTDLEQARRLAQWIAAAGWAPKSYREDTPKDAVKGTVMPFSVEKIAIGILHGMEVGFTPIAALQSIAVINGNPSIWGDGALALVMASGLMEDIVETPMMERRPTTIQGRPGEPDRMGAEIPVCVGYSCTVWRKGKATPVEQEFTEMQARSAGLLDKTGPWQQYRKRMYQMRARAFALRDAFPDVFRGLAFGEEAQDMEMVDVTPKERPVRARTALAALDQFAQAEAPPPAGGGTVDPETGEITDAVDPATKPPQPPPSDPKPDPAPKPPEPMPAQPKQAPQPPDPRPPGEQPPYPEQRLPEQPAPGGTAQLPLEPLPADNRQHVQPTPIMPSATLESWEKRGEWMSAWRWLQAQLLEQVPEIAQVLAERHLELLRKVASHNRSFRNAVITTLDKAQVRVEIE